MTQTNRQLPMREYFHDDASGIKNVDKHAPVAPIIDGCVMLGIGMVLGAAVVSVMFAFFIF